MPPRLERRQRTGNSHYITFSCQSRNTYLSSPASKTHFLEVLEQTRKQYNFNIYAYVVMPEHVHLLLSEPPTTILGTALGVLKRNVSRHHPQSPFWLPRYYDFNIFTNEKRTEKLHYIHQNPVTRGLAETPESYPWSSFQTFAKLTRGPVTLTPSL